MIQEINDCNFNEELLVLPTPVLVLFYADQDRSSGKMIAVMEETAKRYGHQIKIVKANINNTVKLASQYGVSGLPHLLLLNGGNVVAQKIGYISLPALEGIVEPYLL